MTTKQPKLSLDGLSGTWSGYWIQGKIKGIMQIELSLQAGQLRGSGSDRAGNFALSGTYDDDTGVVEFVKHYTHYAVMYKGTWSGRMIRGKWSFGVAPGGNFRMDPGVQTYP